MEKIVVYGAKWCGDCHRSARFLDQHQIEYDYFDIERDSALADRVVELNIQAGHGPKRRIPVILIGEMILSEPSNTELASALGIKE